jgi:hypothetical protein
MTVYAFLVLEESHLRVAAGIKKNAVIVRENFSNLTSRV